jgi:hypothetical protein
LRTLTAKLSLSSGLASAAAVLCLFSCFGSMAAENKKSSPAPAARPAAPAVHPASAPAAHPAGAPVGGAHGPTTTGASHGPTTTSAAHGATGAAASHAVTTSSAHPVTAGGGARPGAVAPHVGAAGGAAASHASFGGRPAPANSHEMHAANGAAVRTRADGTHSDVHDPKRGMDIHHGLNGNRRVSVERADHSRIVSEHGGRGFVQHPYMYHGHEFGHRTYFAHGRAYDRFYGRYGYRGHYYDVYAPRAYYPYGFYGYAYAPWPAPVPYAWAPAPWVAPYGFFYAPYPVYPAPAFWLEDFVFAASLAAAYEAGHNAAAEGAYLTPEPSQLPSLARLSASLGDLLVNPAEAVAAPALSPEVKQQVADEIKALVQQEGNDSKSGGDDASGGTGSVMKLMGDNRPHVFVAGADLDVVSDSGNECAISQGDVLKVSSLPAGDADTVSATVLAGKGNKECAPNTHVTIALSDLQDMHNHMREQVDEGLAELQKKQGTNGLPAAPAGAAAAPTAVAFAKDAPPPETNAADQVAQQGKEADAAEQEVSHEVSGAPAAAPATGGPVNISVGQSIDAVTAALGSPVRIIDLGAKKIYTYKDMKIIFMNGRVSDVQ